MRGRAPSGMVWQKLNAALCRVTQQAKFLAAEDAENLTTDPRQAPRQAGAGGTGDADEIDQHRGAVMEGMREYYSAASNSVGAPIVCCFPCIT